MVNTDLKKKKKEEQKYVYPILFMLDSTKHTVYLIDREPFLPRVSVQGVKSLGGHFACLCRGFEFYEVKK